MFVQPIQLIGKVLSSVNIKCGSLLLDGYYCLIPAARWALFMTTIIDVIHDMRKICS